MRTTPTAAWVRGSVVATVLVMAAVVTGRVELAALGLPLLVWCAWAVLHRPAATLTLHTRPRGRVTAVEGTRVPLRVATDAPGPMLVTAAWPDLDGARWDPPWGCRTDLVAPGAACEVGVDTRTWGSVVLGPAVVTVSDVTGAWRGTGSSGTVRATMRPESATLRGPTGVARPIGVSGVHASARRGDGSALADIRPFQAGDRLRRVNWRVTSRTGELHVTATNVDRDTDVVVVADTLHDMNGPDLAGPSVLDVTARAVVAITRYYVGLGDRVAVSDLGSRMRSVPPGTGLRQARVVSDLLSQVPRGHGSEFRARVARLTPGTLVFVCTPLLDDEVVAEIVRLRRLGGEVVVVDSLPVEMGEQALRFVRADSSNAEAWHLRWLERDATIASLRRAGVPVTAWRGATSLGSVLLAMEAARSAPRRSPGR